MRMPSTPLAIAERLRQSPNGFGDPFEERRGSRAIVRALRQLELCHGDAIDREPRVERARLSLHSTDQKSRTNYQDETDSHLQGEQHAAESNPSWREWPAPLQRLDQVRPRHL